MGSGDSGGRWRAGVRGVGFDGDGGADPAIFATAGIDSAKQKSWGIRRFDANLLIAAVQHRLGGRKPIGVRCRSRSGDPGGWGVSIGLVVAVQALIVLGAWGGLHP